VVYPVLLEKETPILTIIFGAFGFFSFFLVSVKLKNIKNDLKLLSTSVGNTLG